jgi:hypothetical protein
MRTRAWFGVLVGCSVCGVACVQVEPSNGGRGADAAVELILSDWRGAAVDRDKVPRRPRLALMHAAGFAPIDDAILLLRGNADPELVADLERSPLLSAHRTRVVETQVAYFSGGAGIVPEVALDADAEYTLAIAAWARSAAGARLEREAAPLVYTLRTAAAPDAGARVLSSWPADGASAVGTNLAAAVIAFDGRVEAAEEGVWLEGPDGAAVSASLASGPCSEIAPEHAGDFCVRIEPLGRLAPSAAHALVVGRSAVDAHGAPVGPWRATFRSASGSDLTPPVLTAPTCAIDETDLEVGCALIDDASIALRVQADEAISAVLNAGERNVSAVVASGSALLQLTGLPADSAVDLELTLTDSAGNHTRASSSVNTLPKLATLSISELRADPLGPEPQQEFVELWNYGDRTLDLAGFSLSDRTDVVGEPLAAYRVEPHARVLLVADAFDPHEPRDVQPPPGAALLRVGKSLATSGLNNAGERLFLRDAQGRRISAVPAGPRPEAGVCNVRVSTDPRDGSDGAFDYDPEQSCTPGR